MEQLKYKDGAFVFSRSRGLSPMDPEEAAKLAEKYGWDPEAIPGYRGDYTAMMRAVDRVARSTELKKQGLKLEEVCASKAGGEIVYGIVAVSITGKDLAAMKQTLKFDHQHSVGWSKSDPSIVTGEHGIAQMVRDQLARFRGKITGDDWQDAIRSYILSDKCMGAKVRSDGRVYWCPPQRLDVVRQFGAFLAQLGIDLILAEVQPEHVTVVQEVTRETLEETFSSLEVEVAKFEETEPRRSTLVHRLEEYQRLRERASFYKAAMGAGASKAEEMLVSLETRVKALLTLSPMERAAATAAKEKVQPTEQPAAQVAMPQPEAPVQQPAPPAPQPVVQPQQAPLPMPKAQPLPLPGAVAKPAQPVQPVQQPVQPVQQAQPNPLPAVAQPQPPPPLVPKFEQPALLNPVQKPAPLLTSLAFGGVPFTLKSRAAELEVWTCAGVAAEQIVKYLESLNFMNLSFQLGAASALRFTAGDGVVDLALSIKDPLDAIIADLARWSIVATKE